MSQVITVELIKDLRERTGVGMSKCKEALTEANGDIEQAIVILRKAGIASAVKKEGRTAKEGAIASAQTAQSLAIAEVNAETDFVVNNEIFQKFLSDVAKEAAKSQAKSVEELLRQKMSDNSSLTIDEHRAVIMQKMGENIQIRRILVLPKRANHSFGIYSHMGGKILSLIEIAGADTEEALAKEIAMHAAATKPGYLDPESVPQSTIDQEREIAKEQIKGKPANIIEKILYGKMNAFYDQHCLIRQPFVRDDKISIEQLVKNRSKELGKELKIVNLLCWTIGE